jgi:TPR repeat protein
MKKSILTCFVLLALAFQSQGQTLDEIKAKAEQGDALSQAILGQSYRRGELGLAVDNVQARKWIDKSVAQNNPLGLGNKSALDNDKSFDKKALDAGLLDLANAGNAWCQRMIGIYFDNGDGGLTKDPSEAVKWYRKAADQGYVDGQLRLAGCYFEGTGVEKDPVEAAKWFRKAADQGNAGAQSIIGSLFLEGIGVEKDPAEAVKWCRKAADQGRAEAQAHLGDSYCNGTGVEKDPAEAVKWYRKAADQGHAGAQYILGIALTNGEGVPKDPVEAVKWLNKAVASGDKAVAEKANGALRSPELIVIAIKQKSAEAAEAIAKTVKDEDPEKYGGPKTLVVIRLALGGGSSDVSSDVALMVGGSMDIHVKEIKRGEPLTSLISAKIPTGTKVYPIRLVISDEVGSQDFYFYKDEFGEWGAVKKQAN